MHLPISTEYPPYAAMYEGLVGENLLDTLQERLAEIEKFYQALPTQKINFAYAEGKWKLIEVLGHVLDTERIFAYRILSVARGEKQRLPGFDQDAYLKEAFFESRPFEEILAEFLLVRQTTIALAKSLTPLMLDQKGNANGHDVTPRGLLFMVVGHEIHHSQIIKQRYL